jgi:poly(3-hydroxybutyrate) depolymerase
MEGASLRGRLSAALTCAVAALFLAIAPVAAAAPGLDPTFGEGGLAFSGPKTVGGGGDLAVGLDRSSQSEK